MNNVKKLNDGDRSNNLNIKLKNINSKKIFQIDRLVLGGAGNRVHAFLGALDVLEPFLKNCHHFIGTSAGSILQCLLALKCPISQMISKERESPFHIHWYWVFQMVWRFIIYNDGLIPIERLKLHLQEIFISTLIDIHCYSKYKSELMVTHTLTFEWIYEQWGTTLEIQAMDYHNANYFIFNRLNTPKALLLDAVVASCAIPIVFSPCKFENRILCDAAVFSGIPWSSLHSKSNKFLPVTDFQTQKHILNPITIGILLSDKQVHGKTQDCFKENHQKKSDSELKSNNDYNPHSSTIFNFNTCCPDLRTYFSYFSHIFGHIQKENQNSENDRENHEVIEHSKSEQMQEWSCGQLLHLPFQILHNHEYAMDINQEELIQIHVDSKIYGSKFHSLWPSENDKTLLFKQGQRDAQSWLIEHD